MTRWNPSNPDVIGPEFYAYAEVDQQLDWATAFH